MRHQVERPKHVAPRQGVKLARALTAAFVAIGMMVTGSVILSFSAANADSSKADGSLCTPQTIGLGDDTSDAKVDSGVATYVGGNMYVGANTGNYSELNGSQGPDKSYAVEAEGLTLVNGKLAINSAKKSWNRRGFRFGMVGFGSQYRPKAGSDVLVVAGSNNSLTMKDNLYNNSQVVSALGGWTDGNTARGFVNTDTGDQYKAKIKGNTSVPYNNGPKTGEDAAYAPTGSNYSRSVYDAGKYKDATGTDVTYSNDVSLSNVSVNGETKDYSKFLTENVQGLSNELLTAKATGTVAADTAPAGTYSRYHYRYLDSTETGINKNSKYDFHFVEGTPGTNQQKEKRITFTGTNNPSLEVFDVDASMLNSDDYSGISFAFTKISDTASVVINVKGSNAITFNNGWRFWWNDKEISNGYVTTDANGAVTGEMRKAYSTAAQKIMWNFAETPKLTIKGGQALNGEYHQWGSSTDSSKILKSYDDPAAAMLGSIMVPKGSFESHVTTNGRVYVSGDFSMYNPNNIGVNMAEGETASVIDMDQERHNLPWNGQVTAKCPAIQWNKANSAGEALKGTTWNVYGTLGAAKAGTSSLGTITDGEFTDGNDVDGTIKFEGIAKNAKYFVKEFATNSTEYTKVNPYIYQINTGDDEGTYTEIVHVFDSEGNEITGTNADKKLTDSNKIINEKEGAALEWSKVDGDDTNKIKILSGSEWQLKNNYSNEVYRITDSTKAVSAVTIQYKDAAAPSTGISLTYNVAVNLTAIVTDASSGTDGVPQTVKWTSSNPTVASVNDGTVLGLKNGTATITAYSVADSTKYATANITVTDAPADTKNTTTFYFKADGYTSGNTKLHYTLGDPMDPSGWADAVMTTASGCSNWLTVTIKNPDLKAVTYLFQGSNWYHQGSSTTANFTTAANQTVATVENHAATATAPTGCSTGGGSTTIGSVTISGDQHEVGLGKTITLTATPNPSSDTVKWYSGNTSVASVTEGPATTTTITGLKAGTTTITAKTSSGATASVTITVKDDSKVGVYFKKSAVNGKWSNYYLYYQKTADYWPAVKMEDACNGDYVVAYIPKTDAHRGYRFLFRDSTDTKSGHWYGSNGENASSDNFTFWNEGAGMHIESNSSKGVGVPSGCQAIQSAAKMEARVSTAVLRSDKTSTVAINDMDDSVAAQSDDSTTTVYSCGDALGKCDMNTEPGKFRVVDLANGKYTLTEMVVPNGYEVSKKVYTITITNGVASWDPSLDGHKLPNTRKTGTVTWNKVSLDSANDKNKKLGGSEWKLTETKSFGWNATTGKAEYTDIGIGKQLAIPITDCETGKTCSAPAGGQTIYDVDPVKGQFKLTGLEWGTYTLVESKAPDGYDVDSTVRTFTFGPASGSDVTGKWNSNGVAPATGAATGDFTTSEVDYDSSVFTFAVGDIKNQPGVILPATGGEGSNKMYAAGFLAVAIAMIGLALSLKRRQS